MSAASPSIPTTARDVSRPAIGVALALAACLTAAIALGQPAPAAPAIDPVAGLAPVIRDNGWAKAHAPGPATAGTPLAHDHGWSATTVAPAGLGVIGGTGGSSGSGRGLLPR